ncbi:O-succinylhomoserine sulfhydrylase [Insolitispirillum peregrinum]|uniref:O-succinylhomoserine sulfhydrylase n=1 Tax=Insolitispirillum peregrinum TaxID=80876 RepID=UPI00360B2D94
MTASRSSSPVFPTGGAALGLPGDAAAQTRMVHGATLRSGFDETAEAVFMNSGYVYGSAEEAEAAFDGTHARYVYSRFRNPTIQMFEDRLALLEGAEACRATASGMAAVFGALACQLQAGDRLVAARALFGSCSWIAGELLPKWGVVTEFVDGTDLAAWEQALATPAKVVLLETPSNPGLELIDLEAVCTLAHKAGAVVVVDNVFATPMLQHPLQLGADVVVYSATKHIDGQGRCLGGAILGTKAFIEDVCGPFLRHTGPTLSPFNAWTLLKGLETLALRVERHCANAVTLARHLEGKPGVARVLHPDLESHPQYALAQKQMSGGGSVLAIDFAGGKDAAFRFLNALRVVKISNNLGDAKSLACHPATTTHQRLTAEEKAIQGIGPGLLRLSVGLEDIADLIADVDRGLAAL